jgi:membrane associated rhomboid family serine protease
VITYALIAITVAASFYAWSKPPLLAKWMMNPYSIQRYHQYYRFVTSGFIHKDHMHLLFNMFSFYFFGLAIETTFGQLFPKLGGVYYVVLYVLAIVASDLPSYFKHRQEPRYNSLGASGGVSAVVLAFILFYPLNDICIYFALCAPGFIMGVLFIGFSYYQGKRSGSNINHDAHLYGALFGFVFCAVMYPAALSHFVEQVSQQFQRWLSL